MKQQPSQIVLAADLVELSRAREHVEEIGRMAGLPEARLFDLQVAVSEAVANAIEHASSQVELVTWILPDRLIVEITNDGDFQPGLYKDDHHRRRGLGLPLMVSLADQVHVSRLPQDRTRVSLTFFLEAHSHWDPTRLGDAHSVQGAAPNSTGETEAREAEDRYRNLVDLSPDAILVNLDGAYVFANPAAANLFGAGSPSEVVGRSVLRHVHPEDRELVAERTGQILSGAISPPREVRLLRLDGAPVTVEVTGSRVEFGGRLAVQVVMRDISERKQAEEGLRETQDRVRRKLASLLSPGGDIGELELADIIDSSALQSFLDDFNRLACIPLAIIDLEGNVLVGSGWSEICTRFHRVHPQTRMNCIESDTLLTTGVPEGEFHLYKCKNHMWDVSTPIFVGGKHVGNVFSGQFFFEEEPIDRDLFRSQAQTYGFDEQEYLAALDCVPRLSREALETGMGFFAKLAQMVSRESYSSITLARAVAERDTLLESLRVSEERFRLMFERHNAVMLLVDPKTGAVVDGNAAAARFYGYSRDQLRTLSIHDLNELPREEVAAEYGKAVAEQQNDFVFPHRAAGGERRWVEVHSAPIEVQGDELLFSVIHDISDRKQAQERLLKLNGSLNALSNSNQALMKAADEYAYLRDACRIIVEDCGHSMVWIGYKEDEAKRVRPVASAGFEEGYLETLDITWSDDERGQGPSGVAIRTGRRCVCRNTLTDPAFAPWRERARQRGYASSVALPLTEGGVTFGALAIYANEPDAFLDDEMELLGEFADDLATGIVSLRLRARHAEAESERERLILQLQEASSALAASNKELLDMTEELAARGEELEAQNEELRAAQEETERLLEEKSSLFLRLQETLLDIPKGLPGVKFDHLYRSATLQAQVGGDFYDVFAAKNGRIGLLIGDVSGHGVEAARIATLVKDTVHAFAHQFAHPHLVLRETNRLLVEKGLSGFVTAFLGFLDPERGSLTYSSAGHPPPMVFAQGRVTLLESPSPPLGVYGEAQYGDTQTRVEKGSLLLFYTDGITEARQNGEFFGEERLAEWLGRTSGKPIETLASALLEEVLLFSGGHLRDDACLLAVGYVSEDS